MKVLTAYVELRPACPRRERLVGRSVGSDHKREHCPRVEASRPRTYNKKMRSLSSCLLALNVQTDILFPATR